MWAGPAPWRMPIAVCLTVLGACTASPESTPSAEPAAPVASSEASSAVPTATPFPSPTPGTMDRGQLRAILRDRSPDADEVVALAGTPASWVTGRDRLLVEYRLMPPTEWPSMAYRVAVQLLDRRGRVRLQAIDPFAAGYRRYYPAGRAFVGLTPYSARDAVLITDRGVAPLRMVGGERVARTGDLRLSHGWLVDPRALTMTRERLPGCTTTDSIRTDDRGRVWCVAPGRAQVSMTDDGGRTWEQHRLSTAYKEACDGGFVGAELELQNHIVSIGLWRADVSLDRGATWYDVDLPYRLAGAGPGVVAENCTRVVPLRDGRLVLEYFRVAVADDATNTRFTLLRTPPGTRFAGVAEGLLTAASRRPYGTRLVSYDGGSTWRPVRLRELVRELLR